MTQDILTGKWIFSIANLTAIDPNGNGATHQLAISDWQTLRDEIASIAIDHGIENGQHVYWVTERKLRVAEFAALCALPDPTPEQATMIVGLSNWIVADSNDLSRGAPKEEL